MLIRALSDTHGLHDRIPVAPCDLLIHAGDWSGRGDAADAEAFLAWFAAQPAQHRVFIAGNHDLFVESDPGTFGKMLAKYPSVICTQFANVASIHNRMLHLPVEIELDCTPASSAA